jgi:hypothetical protein
VRDLPLRFPSRAAEASLLRGGKAGSIDRSIDRRKGTYARTHARAGGISPPLDFSGDAGVSVLRAWNWAYKPNSSQ